jgi:hypothetical protein
MAESTNFRHADTSVATSAVTKSQSGNPEHSVTLRHVAG